MSDNKPYSMLADAGIRDFLITSDRFYPPDAVALSVLEQRKFYNALCAHFRKPKPKGIKVTDLKLPNGSLDIPIRIYSPDTTEQLPVMLYLHGGGFVVGDLESHDDICAEIAKRADVNVIAVAYRLAPEAPFPAAFDDCTLVLDTLHSLAVDHNFDAERLVVGGDSAGGNLAASLCLYARDSGTAKISGQVLIYPELGGDMTRGSYIGQAEAPGLSTQDVKFYREIYMGKEKLSPKQARFAAPLLETDYSNLPPAFLVAAHHDPLHDDCNQYAEHLKQAGVTAFVRDEPLLVHAFLRARHMSKPASLSFDKIVEAVHNLAHRGTLQ